MTTNPTDKIQRYLENTLDPALVNRAVFTGIFGEQPSVSAKSPFLWNAAYHDLEMDAAFLPFDVTANNLPGLVGALRATPSYLGGSVTVPYKTTIMGLLDEIDTRAQQIGAVNTVARDSDGRLVGYNTDAQGAIDSLTNPMPWQSQAFLSSLKGLRVLLIGAGGAGRAVAFAVADQIGNQGNLLITNRTQNTGAELAESVNQAYGNAISVSETDLPSVLPGVQLIINTSLRGQSGLRQSSDGRVFCLEPYSPLAEADPVSVSGADFADDSAKYLAWYRGSIDDICKNQVHSSAAVLKTNPEAAFLDIIFSPLETTLLSQARLAGHPTLNGKGMSLAQAVDGFVNRVIEPFAKQQGWESPALYNKVFEAMAEVW